jgi:acyl carrier protein
MAKTTDQVLAEVSGIVRDVLNRGPVDLKYETVASDVAGWDSLSHIEVVVSIEKHFGIRFNFADLQKFKNVGEMCDNIAAKLQTAAG